MSTVHSPPSASRPRVALAHDWLCGYRGGEAVLERFAALVRDRYEPAGLYVMFDDRRALAPAIDTLEHVASPLGRLPGGSGALRRWLLPAYPAAVAALSRRLAREHARRPIDLLISTSSAAIKGLRPPAGVPHLCYCHSPARYVWSQRAEYRGGLRGLGLAAVAGPYRRWDARTAGRVTRFLANSTHTAAEVHRCYGREAKVVFPPVRTDFFTPDPAVRREGFWLFVGALEPYKRADLAIEAARLAGRELVVVGDGSERRRLERGGLGDPPRPDRSGERSHLPGGRVRFPGRVGDDALRDLYRRAAVLLFPQVEDFGIVACEALACGLPVAARRAGGALDIASEGAGVLFDDPTACSLIAAAQQAERQGGAACRDAALRFTERRFDEAITAEIGSVLTATGAS